jgi:hypothetical protein
MLPYVTSLSPERNLFRWALRRALQYLGTFPLAVLSPGVLIVLLGALALPPRNATAVQRLQLGLVAFAFAVVAAFAVTYAVVLAFAIYHRYVPVRDPAFYRAASIAAMHREALGSAHGKRLRQIAAQLKQCLDSDNLPRYRTEESDARLWCNAFREHFPDLWSLVDILVNEMTAINALRDRIVREVAVAGLDQPPWVPSDFIPGIVSVAERNCMTGFPASESHFDWHESAESHYWGKPGLGLRVLSFVGPHEELATYKAAFESFVRNVESWPEVANIGMSFEVQQTVKDAVTRQLETIALTDKFTSRCRFCE